MLARESSCCVVLTPSKKLDKESLIASERVAVAFVLPLPKKTLGFKNCPKKLDIFA
jgi:hypothetical protein